MMNRTLIKPIIKQIIRLFQKIFLGLFISTLFPIDLIDIIKYLTSMLDSNLDNLTELDLETASEDSDSAEEDNSVSAGTNNNYLLIIIPATTILIVIVIVGGICDLYLDNLILNQTINDLLAIGAEHVYKMEVTASQLYK